MLSEIFLDLPSEEVVLLFTRLVFIPNECSFDGILLLKILMANVTF